jgi:Ca-activated chloride channel family protein
MNGELLKDKDGEIVVSRLDEEVLKEVAQAGNGAYVRAGNSEFGLNPIIEDLKKLEDEKYNSIVFEEFDEQFMYFLAIALFFFVLEMLVGDRRSKRHLFQR